MSGIVGIVKTDDTPLSHALMERMLERVAWLGPDAQNTWAGDGVALGHTQFRTTEEQAGEHQPFTLDGEVWITADVRVDARDELIKKLTDAGRNLSASAPDVELLLQAYHAWGEECLKHLIGDFAFIIWDGRKRSLFCARDHFGIKPFYYAQPRGSLVLSNSLDCIRRHPSVSCELNDQAVGDFLLFDYNQDFTTTTFKEIRRLPPAHSLVWSRGEEINVKRYWRLPTDGSLRYKRDADYVEHFKELLEKAVSDRLRASSIGVYMSGGLDSTTVAAAARAALQKRYATFDLRSHTTVYNHLIFDEERHYAGIAAASLRMPVHFQVADDYKLYERWDQPEVLPPEPVNDPLTALLFDSAREVQKHSRVVLSGYGVDATLLFPMMSHIQSMIKRRRLMRATGALWQYVRLHRKLPKFDFRGRIRRLSGNQTDLSLYPRWLNQSFAERLRLSERWEEINLEPQAHPTRALAYGKITDPLWAFSFETYYSGIIRSPIEVRHPFFDIRLVNFMLAIPPVPWCINKILLRRAMRGMLPEEILSRPKTPLFASPVFEHARRLGIQKLFNFEPMPELESYIDTRALLAGAAGAEEQQFWINLRGLSLNLWLKGTAAQGRVADKAQIKEAGA